MGYFEMGFYPLVSSLQADKQKEVGTKRDSRILTLNFLMAVVNILNTKTHTSKEMAEFSFENAYVKSIQTEDEKQTATFLRMYQNEAL